MTARTPKVGRISMVETTARATRRGLKTVTRRVAKLTDAGHVKEPGGNRRWHPEDPDAVLACPYGQPGDLLYMQEPWRTSLRFNDLSPRDIVDKVTLRPPLVALATGDIYDWPEGVTKTRKTGRYRHARFMPRELSRVTLEITEVRLERLQEISEEDARAEGIELAAWEWGEVVVAKFAELWDSINAGRGLGWAQNPLVWVVRYRFIHQNVDDVLAALETT